MNDNPFDLMRQLDEHLPPHQADLVDAAPHELIEAARRIAELPPITLSETAVAQLEARLRTAAVTAGPPVERFSVVRSLRFVLPAAALLLIVLAAWVLLRDDDQANVLIQATSTPSVTATATASVTPTATMQPSASPTPLPSVTATSSPTGLPVPTSEPPMPTPPQVDTMVVEGPVESVDGNLIVIYGLAIQLDADNPLTATIQPGDVLNVAGDIVVNPDGVVVTAITFTLVNVEVYFSESGAVFRDDAPCNIPPPPWAPANGWRARCEGGGAPTNNTQDTGTDDDDEDEDDDD